MLTRTFIAAIKEANQQIRRLVKEYGNGTGPLNRVDFVNQQNTWQILKSTWDDSQPALLVSQVIFLDSTQYPILTAVLRVTLLHVKAPCWSYAFRACTT